MKVSTITNNLSRIIGIAIWFIIWHMAAKTVDNIYILPSPLLTLETLLELIQTESFSDHVLASLKRVLLGFSVSVFLGFICGVLSGMSRFIYHIFKPFVVVVRSTPVISVIIIVLVLVGSDTVPVVIAFLMCFPIMWQSSYEGFKHTDPKKLEMAHCFKVRKRDILMGIYLPSMRPSVITGTIITLGMSWKVTVAAEVLSYPKLAIGKEVMMSKLTVETPMVFAWTVVIIVLSFIFEYLLKALLMKLNKGGQHG